MEHQDDGNFTNVSWTDHVQEQTERPAGSLSAVEESHGVPATMMDVANAAAHAATGDEHHDPEEAFRGHEKLECTVGSPVKENDGTKDAFVSYLITTHTTFSSFARETTSIRRRFTDFVFLYKQLCKDFQATAVPPIPDKQRMEYVRGDRFGQDFTMRRAHSLQRFLTRCSLHPNLRRAPILHNFLESHDWNATMRARGGGGGGNGNGNGRGQRGSSGSEGASGGVFDNFADTFINVFTKVNKPDRRFLEVKEKSDKLDEDLGHIEKVIARVARRETDLEADLHDLSEQFQKLITLEPGVEPACRAFSASVEDMATQLKTLREVTDQDYLGSLRDMQAYSLSLRNLLKAREQKQLDFEQLTEYLSRSTTERDALQSPSSAAHNPSSAASGFLRSKLEDVRGVDHEQARRERTRRLELKVEELTTEVERARNQSDLFDDEVVKEVADFERIKRVEMKRQLGGLADAHVEFYGEVMETWERYVKEMEGGKGTAAVQ